MRRALAGMCGALLAVTAGVIAGGPALRLLPALVESPPAASAVGGAAHPRLEVLEQTVVKVDDGDLSVAIVRNPSRRRAVLRVYATEEFLDSDGVAIAWPDDPVDVDNRPSLGPGQTGVLYDLLDSSEGVACDIKTIDVRLVAARVVPRPRPAPIGVSHLRVDRRCCLLTRRGDLGGPGGVAPAWRASAAATSSTAKSRRPSTAAAAAEGVARYAVDPANAKRVWEVSTTLLHAVP